MKQSSYTAIYVKLYLDKSNMQLLDNINRAIKQMFMVSQSSNTKRSASDTGWTLLVKEL